MTQRIFDKDNKKDMDDLWDILPEETAKIKGGNNQTSYLFDSDDKAFDSISQNVIKINWHDKTEITRPVDYESMIGCVGWFGSKRIKTTLSILKSVDCTYGNPWFECKDGKHWDDFTPAKKSELKFYGG